LDITSIIREALLRRPTIYPEIRYYISAQDCIPDISNTLCNRIKLEHISRCFARSNKPERPYHDKRKLSLIW